MKILKSFSSAHEAVHWMSVNKIKGTSIETTPVLKSIGNRESSLSNGNYHVVLKSENMNTQFTPTPGDALLDSVKRLSGGGPVTDAHIKAAAGAHGIDDSLHGMIRDVLSRPEFQPDPTHDMLAAATQTARIREALAEIGPQLNRFIFQMRKQGIHLTNRMVGREACRLLPSYGQS